MTEPNEIRLKKLKEEIAKHPSVAEFARKYDLDATYIRQLTGGHRAFGERAARKMGLAIANSEHFFDLPSNAMVISFANVDPGPDLTGMVPLISWVQAGSWAEAIDQFAPGWPISAPYLLSATGMVAA